mmetsp:Transcript_33979/g.52953  ORF Transcript_33979/g.52953 Transcript_33979/m.52953 type:complete len:150 (-) Transcript_33979:438-887(-)
MSSSRKSTIAPKASQAAPPATSGGPATHGKTAPASSQCNTKSGESSKHDSPYPAAGPPPKRYKSRAKMTMRAAGGAGGSGDPSNDPTAAESGTAFGPLAEVQPKTARSDPKIIWLIVVLLSNAITIKEKLESDTYWYPMERPCWVPTLR